jgi:hypothetical protein
MGENQGLSHPLAGSVQVRPAAILKSVSGNPDAYPT